MVVFEMKSDKKFEELEELDEIQAYDNAKARDDEVIPFDQAIKEIETHRSKQNCSQKP